MASSLSEQQRLKIEENRHRALALRAARQQQQLSVAADCGRKSSPANNRNSVTHTNLAASFAASSSSVSKPSIGSYSAHVRQLSSTNKKYSTKYSSAASFGHKPYKPTTLADSSNRAAISSYSRAELNAAVPVKCCLISRQKFAADCRYFAPLIEVFKSIPSKQYGDYSTVLISNMIVCCVLSVNCCPLFYFTFHFVEWLMTN